jgi:threonine dehydrogenase-like Zn-dependent dehydrogenase
MADSLYADLEPDDEVGSVLAAVPLSLRELPEPELIRPDWIKAKPLLAGVGGSDVRIITADFSVADIDNPAAAFTTFSATLGHEVVAVVTEVGPDVDDLEVGQRIVVDPWLPCAPRAIDPPCPACQLGRFNLCHNFAAGDLGRGFCLGTSKVVGGAWAEEIVVHRSMAYVVPDNVTNAAAVLADPFCNALHSILSPPPRPHGRVLVYGAGPVGMMTVALLRYFYPDVEIGLVGRHPHQRVVGVQLGVSRTFEHQPKLELIEKVAEWCEVPLYRPFDGLPMTMPGGLSVVYDTIGNAHTIEVSVRLLEERGSLVMSGTGSPHRTEWTPIWFKELSVYGCSGYGIEELAGERKHPMEIYFDLLANGLPSLDQVLTHRFSLDDWNLAVRTLVQQEESQSIRVAFEPNGPQAP